MPITIGFLYLLFYIIFHVKAWSPQLSDPIPLDFYFYNLGSVNPKIIHPLICSILNVVEFFFLLAQIKNDAVYWTLFINVQNVGPLPYWFPYQFY